MRKTTKSEVQKDIARIDQILDSLREEKILVSERIEKYSYLRGAYVASLRS